MTGVTGASHASAAPDAPSAPPPPPPKPSVPDPLAAAAAAAAAAAIGFAPPRRAKPIVVCEEPLPARAPVTPAPAAPTNCGGRTRREVRLLTEVVNGSSSVDSLKAKIREVASARRETLQKGVVAM